MLTRLRRGFGVAGPLTRGFGVRGRLGVTSRRGRGNGKVGRRNAEGRRLEASVEDGG